MAFGAGYDFLDLSRPSPGLLLITLNRPERLNAIDDRGHAEILRVLIEIDEDPEVRAAVFTGAGRAFCAGGDISEPLPEGPAERSDALHRMYERNITTVNRLLMVRKPIVSAVNGVAVGAGLRLALLADISVVASDAELIDGHAPLGVTAGDHSALLWPLLCGMAKAKYYLLTSAPITGEDADRLGLVSMSVPADEVLERALRIAEGLAAAPEYAVRGTKRVLNHWLRLALPAYEHSAALEALNFLHPDSAERLAAARDRSTAASSEPLP
ncbi:MAG: enoyl-CoA hydratase [Pseudonocardiales bacterium]|nr:enoyl-CoA hydratase [Pseudonocardiales bacterium]